MFARFDVPTALVSAGPSKRSTTATFTPAPLRPWLCHDPARVLATDSLFTLPAWRMGAASGTTLMSTGGRT